MEFMIITTWKNISSLSKYYADNKSKCTWIPKSEKGQSPKVLTNDVDVELCKELSLDVLKKKSANLYAPMV